MKTHSFFTVFIILSLVFILGCPDPDPPTPEPALQLTIGEPTEKTETGFMLHWTTNRTDISSLAIEICQKNDFVNLVKQVNVADPTKTSQEVDGLNGATNYFVRIKVVLNDGTNSNSKSKKITTKYQTEPANVTTTDGLNIVGDLYYLNSNPAKSPAVILMGVFTLSNQWKSTDIFNDLVASGYVCYIFNYRGHSGSDTWPIFDIEIPDGLEEFVRVYAREDLHACYTYLKNHDLVDSTKIALMGGSLGANMSMVGNNWPGVKASVGLSTSRLGIAEGLPLQNVLFLASDQDCNSFICFDEEAVYLYNSALEPKKIAPIVPGDFHALELLGQLNCDQEILDWINAKMAD